MDQLPHANSYCELRVYQKQRVLAQRVFEVTSGFPNKEDYSLTDQIRRSSRSIGAQIAEAWGKRHYEKHFVSKLTDALAEPLETRHWAETASDCRYLDEETLNELTARCDELGRMLNGMISKSDLFCSHSPNRLAESPLATYFTK